MLISKAALEAGHSVAIYSLPKLLARIRRTYDSEPGGDSYLSFFERLTSVDLLHIDDLGAEKRSDWVLEQLYALINERYEAQRSVLITTNLRHEELEEQIGTPHRLAAEPRSATRCRSSATIAATATAARAPDRGATRAAHRPSQSPGHARAWS